MARKENRSHIGSGGEAGYNKQKTEAGYGPAAGNGQSAWTMNLIAHWAGAKTLPVAVSGTVNGCIGDTDSPVSYKGPALLT